MRKWSSDIVDQWKKLRKEGLSYTSIGEKYSVSKSTLSYWLKGIDDNGAKYLHREQWMKIIQPMGALANKKIRDKRLGLIRERVIHEVRNINYACVSDKSMLAVLYWAEGAKGRGGGVTFANTDPELMSLFVSLFRRCFKVEERKFRIRLHLHYYHDEKRIKEYWSMLTGIPLNQFTKTYRKRRGTNKLFRKNSLGICFLRYHSEAIKDEIMMYARCLANRLIDVKQP